MKTTIKYFRTFNSVPTCIHDIVYKPRACLVKLSFLELLVKSRCIRSCHTTLTREAQTLLGCLCVVPLYEEALHSLFTTLTWQTKVYTWQQGNSFLPIFSQTAFFTPTLAVSAAVLAACIGTLSTQHELYSTSVLLPLVHFLQLVFAIETRKNSLKKHVALEGFVHGEHLRGTCRIY